jgi:hypothetical protein
MSETPVVVVFPRGQLSPKDKERLTKHGIVAVEADDPKAVNVLSLVPGSSAQVSADDLFMSAILAVTDGGVSSRFGNELYRRLKQREAAATLAKGEGKV